MREDGDFPGKLFIVEGIDGSGKSTQLDLLHKWLVSQGYLTVFSEWNSSPIVKSTTKRGKRRRLLSPVLKLFATTCISGCGCPNTSEAVATLRCCCPCEKAYASAMAITVTTRTIRNLRRRITRPPTFQRIESPRWPSPSRGRTRRPLP